MKKFLKNLLVEILLDGVTLTFLWMSWEVNFFFGGLILFFYFQMIKINICGELIGKNPVDMIMPYWWNVVVCFVTLVLFYVIARDTHLAIGIAAYILANMVWSAVKQLFQ